MVVIKKYVLYLVTNHTFVEVGILLNDVNDSYPLSILNKVSFSALGTIIKVIGATRF